MKTYPKTVRTLLYLFTLAAILWYPAQLILRLEYPKIAPKIYKFEVKGYDPYDPFRGRYIRLRLLPNQIEDSEVKIDQAGFRGQHRGVIAFTMTAQQRPLLQTLVSAFKEVPSGCNAIPVKYYRSWRQKGREYWTIKWPFDRFYLNEKLAPEAEAWLQNITRDTKRQVELQVAIYADGLYAVRELVIDGQPLTDLLRKNSRGSRSK